VAENVVSVVQDPLQLLRGSDSHNALLRFKMQSVLLTFEWPNELESLAKLNAVRTT
jgi:hypothetical protein